MIPFGGFDIRNLLTGPSMALLLLYIGIMIALGWLVFSFRGHVVV